ncbi:hypothetical protein MFIFM68171_09392 [Madurella fahalii]|uniref:Uncharacterized protein n=1 Tax=Madurella fahalii TaxID=1157608 RepID=A0ABQ0GN35_9PEZI
MAQLEGQNRGPNLAQTPPTSSPVKPITPGTTRPKIDSRRQSRFIEEIMTEHMPTSSFVARFDWKCEPSNHKTRTTSFNVRPISGITPGKRTRLGFRCCVRLVNAILHIVPCLMLLLIIGHAIREIRPEPSIVLVAVVFFMIFLSLDLIIDLVTLFRVRKPWPVGLLMCRVTFGFNYMAVLTIYLTREGIFQDHYAYGGLHPWAGRRLAYILTALAA